MRCGVCGGTEFMRQPVLWDKLIREWQLSPEETAYVNRQQGECCTGCGCNLRSIALANAIRGCFNTNALLLEIIASPAAASISILELNEAGMLTRYLKHFGGYRFGAYPEVDMHALPFGAATFDMIIHSDTLEHVPNPIHGLAECRRVLKPGGALCYTVPTIIGRLSRDREGLEKSYHGNSATGANDMAVQTEFGADAWTYPVRAGFSSVTIHSFGFPAATAIVAQNGLDPS